MRKASVYLVLLLLCGSMVAQDYAPVGRFMEAVQLYVSGDTDRALAKFQVLGSKYPSDDAVSYYIGLCRFAKGDASGARSALETATQLDTANIWYISTLASLYEATGSMEAYADKAEKLMKLSPGSFTTPYALTGVGRVRLEQGLDSLALSYFNQALEMDPSYAPAELGKMEALRIKKSYVQYFASLERFIANEDVPSDVKGDYLTAFMEHIDAKFYWVWGKQFARVVDQCVAMNPQETKSRLLKINLLVIENDLYGALGQIDTLAEFARARGDKGALATAYSYESDLAHKLGDMKRTYAALDKVLEVDPGNGMALNNYAYFLCQEGRSLRKALKMSRKAVEVDPDNTSFLDTLGWILYLVGKPAEAKPYFKHAMIYGGKDSAVILEHYSIVLDALGEKDLSIYYSNLAKQKSE